MEPPNTSIITRTLRYGDAAIIEAARAIAAGAPVAVPTETVYGLAADATDSAAVARIYAAKGRPSFNPLIVHVPDLAAAEAIGVFDDDDRSLADAFWPGPLTLVVPLRADAKIASIVTAGLATIALRVPAHRAMRGVLAATGKPLAAPSANASGAISPTRAAHVLASLGGRIGLVIDDGPTEAGLESTIVMNARILRPGPITQEALSSVVQRSGDEDERDKAAAAHTASAVITAPGQLASHYAPVKALRLNVAEAEADEWLIGFGSIGGDDTLSHSADPVEAAARLFDALHRADASPRPRIAIAPVPDDGIGAAINDRLRRAAHRD